MFTYNFEKLINPSKLHDEIVDASISAFSYVETVGEEVIVYFSEELTSEQITALTGLVTSHQPSTAQDLINDRIKAATSFGDALLNEFTIENVMLGITQAGKTRAISNYCHKLAHYISTGSLYAAIEQIDEMLGLGLDPTLEPFVTEARLLEYKAKIQAFLAS